MSMVVTRPAPAPRLALPAAALGAGVQLAVMGVYQLLRIGAHVASTVTAHGAAGVPPRESADRIFGIYILGGLLSIGPALVAGGLTGALLGNLMRSSWHRQGPVRAWLTGTLVAYGVVALINGVVLARQRKEALQWSHWLSLLGYPSLLFVLSFGVIGAWLYLSRTWTISPE